MAVRYNPKIITDGLVMIHDAGNVLSYPGSGSNINNLVSSDHAGTLQGNAAYSSDDGGVFTNDGNDYIDVAGTPVGESAYTKMIWFRLNSGAQSSNNNLISSSTGGHVLWIPTGNTLRAAHTDTSLHLLTSSVTCEEQRWYHAAVTFNTSSGWVLYQDSIVVDTDSTTSVRPGDGGTQIGAYNNGNSITGKLSCPTIYNRALTSTEILQNFHAMRGRFGL